MLALVVALCLVSGALGASRFHERNHTGLLFLYTFDEGQVTTSPPAELQDASERYLMGNLTASTTGDVTWNVERQGMRIPTPNGGRRATSQLTSNVLLSHLTHEFSIEFFLNSPQNPRSQSLLIAGFGDWPPGAPFADCEALDPSTDGGWRLYSTLGANVLFTGVVSENGTPACVLVAATVVADSLSHIVVRAKLGSVAMVHHGGVNTKSDPAPTFDPMLWARHPAPLTIGGPHVDNGWLGTIRMIAMYDRYLSNDEIAANRGFGPPNSVPYGVGAVEADEDVAVTLVSA